MRHRVAASRSALASEDMGFPPLVVPLLVLLLPTNRPATSEIVPHAKPKPKEANPAARPTRDDGTARPSCIREVVCSSSSSSSCGRVQIVVVAESEAISREEESDEDFASSITILEGLESFSPAGAFHSLLTLELEDDVGVSACNKKGFGSMDGSLEASLFTELAALFFSCACFSCFFLS